MVFGNLFNGKKSNFAFINSYTRLRECYVGKNENYPCRFTISFIQIGAKGDVQPLETG